jgi:hypothetical protein
MENDEMGNPDVTTPRPRDPEHDRLICILPARAS